MAKGINVVINGEYNDKDIQRALRDIGQLEKDLQGFGSKFEALGKKTEGIGKKIAGAGTALTKSVTLPLVALGGASVLAFSKVEDGLAEIGKATGATGKDLEDFGETFRAVLGRVPEDSDTVAKAIGDLATRFDVTGESLEDLTEQALAFARVNNTDVPKATRMLGRLLNAVGKDAGDAEEVMDKLTFAAQETGIEVGKLGDFILDAGPAFEELGFGLDKSIALFSTFEQMGARPEEVISSLNLAINRMAKEAGKLDELERGLIDPAEMFEEFLQQIKDAPDILAATTLASELFGSRVGAKVAEDIRDGRFEVADFAEEIANVSGVVSDTAEATETFRDRMDILKNRVMILAASFGEILVPMIERVVGIFQRLMERFEDLSPEQREMIIRFGMIAAAVGPILIVVGKFLIGIGKIIAIVNPLTLKIAAVIAIAALLALGFKFLWENSETLRDTVKSVWDTIQSVIQRVVDRVKKVLDENREAIDNVKSAFMAIVRFIVDHVVPVIVELYSFFLKRLIETIGFLVEAIIEVIAFFVRFISKLIEIGAAIAEWVATALEHISRFVENIKENISNAFNAVKDFIAGVFDSIYKTITGTIRSAVNFAIGAINRLINAWNSLSFNIPAVTIGIGPLKETFGPFSIGTPKLPNIPALAQGGIVTRPTLALVGEAGPEAVIPLTNRKAAVGGTTINLTVNAGLGADGGEVGRQIVDVLKQYERRNGPVYVSA